MASAQRNFLTIDLAKKIPYFAANAIIYQHVDLIVWFSKVVKSRIQIWCYRPYKD